MSTIVCNHCHQEKPEEEFNWRYLALGQRQRTCRECQKRQKNDWYARNSATHKANTLENKRVNKNISRKFVWDYLMLHPCVDCGETDPIVLEFDHVRAKKRLEISRMVALGYLPNTIMKEIEKCEVRCRNCHFRRHHREGGWYAG